MVEHAPHPTWRQDVLHEYRIRPWRQRNSPLSTLRDIYSAALGYQVDATNLQACVLERRNVITRTGTTRAARDAAEAVRPALYRFTDSRYRVTDEFAAFAPSWVSRLDS